MHIRNNKLHIHKDLSSKLANDEINKNWEKSWKKTFPACKRRSNSVPREQHTHSIRHRTDLENILVRGGRGLKYQGRTFSNCRKFIYLQFV